MDAPEKPKRPRWQRKRCLAVFILWIGWPILYALSWGPATYCLEREWLPLRFYKPAYTPVWEVVLWKEGARGSRGVCLEYLGWWVDMARRHHAAARRTDGPTSN